MIEFGTTVIRKRCKIMASEIFAIITANAAPNGMYS